MDDKTLEALTVLAVRLNTSAEHLWGVLAVLAVIGLVAIVRWVL